MKLTRNKTNKCFLRISEKIKTDYALAEVPKFNRLIHLYIYNNQI
jgi:hypothetical protein